MIRHGIGIASGAAPALLAATLPSSASLASLARAGDAVHPGGPGRGTGHRAGRLVASQGQRSPRKGSVTPIDTATNTHHQERPRCH
jgi:hypothetical protein